MEENFNKTKISMILNYIIFILVMTATIIAFTGIKFMYGEEPVLESSTLGIFRFFTFDSNLLMGITSLIFASKEKKVLSGEIKDIPTWLYILKLVSTVSVTLTFVVVLVYLAPILEGGLMSLLQNSNLFFHLIIPVLSITTFIFFEKTRKILFINNVCSLFPVITYGLFYFINVFIHLENGKALPKYDWYHFAQNGLNQAYYIAPIMLSLTFIISVLIWIINKKNK